MVVPQITTRVCSLDNHLLAIDRARGKGQFIARAAPGLLVTPRDIDGRPAVGKGRVQGPWALRRAHKGIAAGVAARPCGAVVVERSVVLVARLDLAVVALFCPPAARFASIRPG